MKKLRLRTKILGILAVSLLILLTITSVVSIPRTITDTYDNVDTFIKNSNGNYWEATSANIQTALVDLGSSGGTVWLPGKTTFMISSAITLDNNVQLIGAGRSTNLKKAPSNNGNVLAACDKENILISNIQIDGNRATGGNNGIHLGGDNGCRNVTIRDCYIHDTTLDCIFIRPNSSYITVENCYIEGCNSSGYPGAIEFKGEYGVIKNNYIKDTYGCGIIVESPYTPAHHVIIDGNIITGNIGHGIHLEPGCANNITVVNNHIFSINSTAYIGAGTPHWSKGIIAVDNTTISNNIVENVQYAGIDAEGNVIIINNNIRNVSEGSSKYGIYHSYYGYAVINGNHVSNVTESGIYGYTNHDVISNNIISDCGSSTGGGISRGGIITGNHIRNCRNGINVYDSYTMVSDNMIYNSLNIGISVASTNNAIVSDNLIKNSDSIGIYLYNAINCTITGNYVVDSTNEDIKEGGSSPDWNIIANNNCRGTGTGISTKGANTVKDTNWK